MSPLPGDSAPEVPSAVPPPPPPAPPPVAAPNSATPPPPPSARPTNTPSSADKEKLRQAPVPASVPQETQPAGGRKKADHSGPKRSQSTPSRENSSTPKPSPSQPSAASHKARTQAGTTGTAARRQTQKEQSVVAAQPSQVRQTKRVATVAKVRKVPTAAGEQLAQQEEERRQMPSWLASLIFHLGLLLVLALIPIKNLVSGPLTLVFGESGPQGTAEFELRGVETSTETMPLMEATTPLDATVDPTEFLEDIELPELAVETANPGSEKQLQLESLPFGIKNGLTGRSGALKDALLAKYGGTAETEEAVELGLKWLAKQQKSDGSWSLIGPYADGGATENVTAATSMALNAFLGAGYTHKDGKYRENVKLGLAYLVRRQNSEGFYPRSPPSRHTMYAQAIATIAVTEAFGMSGDEDLRSSAMKAISFAEWAQSQDLKGWRYYPREGSDLSVTGWYVMALITGKMAGLPVDEDKLQSVNQYLDSVSHEKDTRYAYQAHEGPLLSMTAEGLLCRIYLGWTRSDPALLAAIVDDLLPNKPRLNDREYSVYYWYYATQVLHHVGGKFWEEWNQAMRSVLPAMQEKVGKEAGSWDPSQDIYGPSGGRLYTTCLNLYCLEVYYRHLALYDLK